MSRRAVPAHILHSELSLSAIPLGERRMRFDMMPPCLVKMVITGGFTSASICCVDCLSSRELVILVSVDLETATTCGC